MQLETYSSELENPGDKKTPSEGSTSNKQQIPSPQPLGDTLETEIKMSTIHQLRRIESDHTKTDNNSQNLLSDYGYGSYSDHNQSSQERHQSEVVFYNPHFPSISKTHYKQTQVEHCLPEEYSKKSCDVTNELLALGELFQYNLQEKREATGVK